MTKRLNQVIAIEKSVKTRAYALLTDLHKTTQKHDLTDGFAKAYQPIKDDGVKLPSENKRAQVSADDVFKQVSKAFIELFDVTATKDYTNCVATADVIIDGKVLMKAAPATYLMFVRKQLTDFEAFVGKFVELKNDIEWNMDSITGLYKSSPVVTHKTEKVQEPLTLHEPTKEHPAQTQLITKDMLVGHWTTVHYSGALPRTRKIELLDRIHKALNAVKEALETANQAVASEQAIGKDFFDYLFA